MNGEKLKVLKNVDYANLNKEQEKRLKEFESRFNSEFGEDYNIMIMKRENN